MVWTPEKIKLLKKLWLKGKSTIEIGKELGMSKNAVVGKVHRLELAARPSPIKKNQKQAEQKQKQTKIVSSNKVSLMDLKLNSCRWPIGDPKDEDFHFCGADTVTGKPYCSEHCKIAYTSLKELTLQNAKAKKEAELKSYNEDELDEEDNIQKIKENKKKTTTKTSSKKVAK